MKYKVSLLMVLSILLVGCQAMRTIKTDHLKADEWNENTVSEAMETFKKDYLGMEETSQDRKRIEEIEFIAKQQILNSDYAQEYELSAPAVDRNPGMPEAFSYYFVHFTKLSPETEPAPTTYLVVIDRYSNKVKHSALFTPPQGDPFYRYHDILKEIEGK